MPKSSRKIQLSANFEVSPVKRKCQEQQQNRKGMLFGLILHLVLISKQKSDIIF